MIIEPCHGQEVSLKNVLKFKPLGLFVVLCCGKEIVAIVEKFDCELKSKSKLLLEKRFSNIAFRKNCNPNPN